MIEITWEDPPRQATGSMDCEFFAASYICRGFGFESSWEEVKRWKETAKVVVSRYPELVHGIKPSFSVWAQTNEEAIDNWRVAHSNANPDFRQWVIDRTAAGEIGYASYHAGSKDYNHAVPLLEADDQGVLIADSVNGLIRLPWKQFTDPYDSHKHSAFVWAWYKI